MGWFGNRDDPAPQATPAPQGPTIDSVRAQLDQIGQFRLRVHDPTMKALLSQIAWSGEPYLVRQSTNGVPSGAQLIKMASSLQTVWEVVQGFVQCEVLTSADDSVAADRLAGQLDAVRKFATSLAANAGTSSFSSGITADVSTDVLNRLTLEL